MLGVLLRSALNDQLAKLAIQENPVFEALFNFVNVWSLMLWPLMLADPKGVKVKNKAAMYGGTQVSPPTSTASVATYKEGTALPCKMSAEGVITLHYRRTISESKQIPFV